MKVQIEFEKRQLLFDEPLSVIKCYAPSELPDAFKKIEDALNTGYHVAGFISYEAGHLFEERLKFNDMTGFPLVQFGVYKNKLKVKSEKLKVNEYQLSDIKLNISREEYGRNIDRIREHIANGDVYQITYCIKHKFNFSGDAYSLYKDLLKAQPVPYSAYIEDDDIKILSLSPERFIKKSGTELITEPMKGTWWRGKNVLADMIEKLKFGKDKKNKAENIMIADLLRNDLGRIGTDIKWPKIHTITPYRTLFQMTSTVTGKVDRDIRVSDIFKAMFPSGSVTGAPKIRAMEIIKEIENEDRHIYTGAIGYITPQRDMYFNIPIRTILLRGERGEMGIGGGIVWDSTAEGEWNEGMLKSRFLTDLASDKAKSFD
jgi:para-aminobenzoate synthetase / 4-amino-4-deoxychorismate lyase